MIEKDIINCDIPLVLSFAFMKHTDMKFHSKDDTAPAFNKTTELNSTKSDH